MTNTPRGRGRPVLTPAEPTKRITVTLPVSLVAYLRRLGHGNKSEGVRAAIEFHRENRP